jgi:DNA-binding LacI/PurR family transcriptional regulator
MTVKLEDVAKKSGFSVPTVSRVLTNSPYPVSEKARQKILAVAQEMGYRPNIIARSLRTDRTDTIGIVVDDLLSPFTPPIIRGIQDYLAGQNFMSLILNTDFNPELEKKAIDSLLGRPVDGIIFVEFSHQVPLAELEMLNKPFVFVHRLFGQPVANSVAPDDYHNAGLAVDHLVGLGHRRIGHVSGPQGWHTTARRLAAYQDRLAAHGIPLDPALVRAGDWELSSGYAAGKDFLSLAQRPTAVFAANDLMALGAVYAIQEAGLRVPGDLAVVGYDNRDFTTICRPQLTTVSLPVYEMGWLAGELMLGQVADSPGAVEEIKVKGKLYIRESCGAEPALHTAEEPRSRVISRRILLNLQPDE